MVNPPEADFTLRYKSALSHLTSGDSRIIRDATATSDPWYASLASIQKGDRGEPRFTLSLFGEPQLAVWGDR